ncbi:hypothetical protein NAEGRDRAFT_79129 [Naegleria gruberi]|uniref:GPS domain-containing protein n=1 Tax=Naegleria gruberi TaxID=5762 RepID=D2V990_NAEGR|nr:uncharacterized protein NAEGRDRAFT_79129 [Naegleria gruberi]EFC46548.1 hypothetical protein NAEGRDRAFT_79129 [Naegleria gruberi]|eukprot:XP_002679292.1 hypothetical protein NAEGRDRAFT_79129 [Naegleria gruberi strain NEG-M]
MTRLLLTTVVICISILLALTGYISAAVTCNGVDQTDPSTCSGHGLCKSNNNCACLDMSPANTLISQTGGYNGIPTTLNTSRTLTSSNGQYQASLDPSTGRLQVQDVTNSTIVYQSATLLSAALFAPFELRLFVPSSTTCQISIYGNNVLGLTLTGTVSAILPCRLVMRNNGELVMYSSAGFVWWTTNPSLSTGTEDLIYQGVNCASPTCYGILAESPNVCSGNGTCTFTNSCSCKSGHFGDLCDAFKCFGNLANDTLNVCSGNGNCISPNVCSCNSGFYGPNCDLIKCFDVLSNETSSVCSGHGICSSTDNCTCANGYLGSKCNQFECFGISNSVTSGLQLPCSGNGTCTGIDQCVCQSGFIGNECETFKCSNFLKNDTLNVCSGNGSCIAPNQCSCQSGFFGSTCEAFKCGNALFNSSSVCSGNGFCNAPDQCICKNGYSGSLCDKFTCFGIANDLTSGGPLAVCSGNGTCSALDKCICNSGFLGDSCDTFKCFNKLKNDSLVCSGKGSCILPETCSCSLGYEGLNCDGFKCFNKLKNDSSVCSGNGLCTDINQCSCKNNWLGLDCSVTSCFNLLSNDTTVCSSKGSCVGFNQCSCQSGYFGSLCDVKKCFSYLSNETSLVCNGQGTCTDLDTCSCNSGFLSNDCSVNTNPFSISLNVSSLSIYQATSWNSVKISLSEVLNVNLINFNWYCLDCVTRTSSNLQKGLVSSSQILQFRTSDLVAGTFTFIANATFSNISPYPKRVSNSVSFKLTVLDINVPTLDVFGLPSVIISKIDQPISSIVSSMTLNQTLIQSFIGKCSNVSCSTQVTYSWTISSADNTFKASSDGITNILNLVDSTITISPPIQLTTNLLSLLNSTLTFSLSIVNPLLKSLTSLIQIPIVSPALPPTVNIPGWTSDVYGANTTISNVMRVSPSQGISLTNLFTITIESWSADSRLLPLKYAVGFYDKKTSKPIRVTEYSNQTEISIYLPYMKSSSSKRSITADLESVELVVFIMDVIGNIDFRKSATVYLSPFSGTATQLTEKINSLTGYAITVASYDQSLSLLSSTVSDLTLSLIKNITIDPKFPTAALNSLQSLTADVNSLTREIVIEVNSKLNGFITSVNGSYADDKKNYGFVKSKLANSDVTLTVSVSSNLLQSVFESEGTKNVVNQLVSTILFGEIANMIQSSQKTLSSVSYSSNLIDFAVSSFILSNQVKSNQTQSILMGNYTSVSMNISNIMSQYNAFSKDCGISLIVYSKNTNFDNSTNKLKLVSSVNDFKFSVDSSVVPLSDLTQPIILQFELVDELTTILESLKNETLNVTQNDPTQSLSTNEQKYLCKYWDESSQLWSSKGCSFKSVNLQSKTIECSCVHTTMFTTFIEQNSTFISNLKDQVSALYSVQIAFGIIYASVATVILIGLIAFRKEQPVSSRLMTPYFGMVALIAESVLIYIIQRSILADQLLNSSPSVWETGDTAANIIANVVAIVVNTLNLTAILSYVIQVTRFQLMKYLYQILSSSRGNEQKSEHTINVIRFLTAPSLSNSILSAFAGVNVIYWLLWVILRRTNAIEPATYTYIVSISYTVCILVFSVLITIVAVLDFIGSTKKHLDMNTKRRTAMDHLVENPSSSFKKDKKKFVGNPAKIFRDWLITLDGPLYFRMEMILYIICFIFLVLNQGIGLSSLPYRYESVDSFRKALLSDGISFIFEVLYVVSYIFVFGGYALIITLKYKYQKWKYQQALKAAATEPQNEEIWIDEAVDEILSSQEGTSLFETFCVKEFSCENLYLYQDLHANKEIIDGNNFKDLPRFMSFVFHNYVKVGAPSEVNLPSSSRNSFLFLFRSALSQKETFSSSQQIKLDSNLLRDFEAVEKEIHTENIPIVELNATNIKDCFENLDRNVLINIGDTFSRFVYTPEYKIFKKAKELQNAMIQKANIVYGL